MSPSHSKLCDVSTDVKYEVFFSFIFIGVAMAVLFCFVTFSFGDANGMLSCPIDFSS